MVLAEPRRGIAIVPEDFADGGVVRPDDGIIARIAGGHFADHAEAHRMMVAAGDQRGARGRAKRGGVELRCSASPPVAMRSIAGVGMTPPKVPETP